MRRLYGSAASPVVVDTMVANRHSVLDRLVTRAGVAPPLDEGTDACVDPRTATRDPL